MTEETGEEATLEAGEQQATIDESKENKEEEKHDEVETINIEGETEPQDKEKALKGKKILKHVEAKSDQQFMQYLMDQYVKMQDNSINLDIAVNNIDKIKALQYNDDGVKVYFKH